jgi:uncharacterized protein involved in exopolysaccharide biosynthesis
MERAMPQALPTPEAEPTPAIFGSSPPRPTVGDAMRRYWVLVLLGALVCGAVGAYVGHSRTPEYQATASLSVGLLDLTTQSVPGFAVGGEVVAGGYSRSVQTDSVVLPVARRLKLDPADVRGRVSSTAVPNSPIFTITARSASPGDAVRLANAASAAMVSYGRSRSNTDAAYARLLDRYRQAVRRRDRARSRLAKVRAGTPAPGEVGQARADLETEQLRVDSLAQQYRERTTAPGSTAVVQPLVDAQSAASNRGSKTQLYGALGALAGVCVGAALAVLLTGIRGRRPRLAP